MKIRKLLPLVLAVAILAVIAITVGASAVDTYDIEKITVSHGDRTYVLMAIDAPLDAAEAGEVEVTYSYGGESFTAEYYEGFTVTFDGVEYPVFYTHGISPKDIGEDIIAEAHRTGAEGFTPKTYNVSIAEYLYNQLYVNGYAFATEGEALNLRTLYEMHLAYGAAAQQALHNDKDENADNQRVKVTERSYVYCAYATLGDSGAKELLLPGKTAELTLTPIGELPDRTVGWTVTSYTSEGVSVSTFKNTNTVTVNATSVITPFIQNGMTFDGHEVGTKTGITGIALKDDYGSSVTAGSTISVALDPKDAANKVILSTTYGDQTSSWVGGNTQLKYTTIESAANANVYAVEFDMLVTRATAIDSPFDVYMYDGNSVYFFASRINVKTVDGAIKANFTVGDSTSNGNYKTLSNGHTVDSWCRIRLEYYLEENTVKLYVDGNYIAENTDANYKSGSEASFTTVRIYTTGSSNMDMYLDNIFAEKIVKSYVSGDPNAQ